MSASTARNGFGTRPSYPCCALTRSRWSQAKFERKKGDVAPRKKGGAKKAKKVLVKQEERELGWGGFDDVAPPTRTTVVLKNVFDPADFAEDITLRQDLETDMREECGKLGEPLAISGGLHCRM